MNKLEQAGAQELLSMLSDVELMSVKDTVTKSMVPANSVRYKKKKHSKQRQCKSLYDLLFSVRKLSMLV